MRSDGQVPTVPRLYKYRNSTKIQRKNSSDSLEKNLPISCQSTRSKAEPKIPFYRPSYSRDELENVLDCLISEEMNSGRTAKKFAQQFSKIFSLPECIAVDSLGNAYSLVFQELALGANDVVLVHPFTSRAAWLASIRSGLQIKLIDCAPESYAIDLELLHQDLEKLMSRERRVVLILESVFGASLPTADRDALRRLLAENERFILLEEFSHLLGLGDREKYAASNSDSASDSVSDLSGKQALGNQSAGWNRCNDKPGPMYRPEKKRRWMTGGTLSAVSPLSVAPGKSWQICDLTGQRSSVATGTGAIVVCPSNEAGARLSKRIFADDWASFLLKPQEKNDHRTHDHRNHGHRTPSQSNNGHRTLDQSNNGHRNSEHHLEWFASVSDFRIPDLHAAIGLAQVQKAGFLAYRRQMIAREYFQAVQKSESYTYFQNPQGDSYTHFPVLSQRGQVALTKEFRDAGISVMPLTAVTSPDAYAWYTSKKSPVRQAHRLLKKAVLIPIYPLLSRHQVSRVTKVLLSLCLFAAFLFPDFTIFTMPRLVGRSKPSKNWVEILTGEDKQQGNRDLEEARTELDKYFPVEKKKKADIVFCDDRKVSGNIVGNDLMPEEISLKHEIGQVGYEKKVQSSQIQEVRFLRWQGQPYRESKKGVIYRFVPVAYKVRTYDQQSYTQKTLPFSFWEQLTLENKYGQTTLYSYWLDLLQPDGKWDSGNVYHDRASKICHKGVIKRIIYEKEKEAWKKKKKK